MNLFSLGGKVDGIDNSVDFIAEAEKRAVREMKRVAKPGGRLAIIEPDFSTQSCRHSNRHVVNSR